MTGIYSETTFFADGWGTLHAFYLVTSTRHLWIQEDAWGNCTFFWSG